MRIKNFIFLALASISMLIGLPAVNGQTTNPAPTTPAPRVFVPDAGQQNTIPAILAGAAQRGQNPAASNANPAFRMPPASPVQQKPTTSVVPPSQATKPLSIQPLSSSQKLMQSQQQRLQSLPGLDAPRVDPDELRRHQQQIEERLRQIRLQMDAAKANGQPLTAQQANAGAVTQPVNSPAPMQQATGFKSSKTQLTNAPLTNAPLTNAGSKSPSTSVQASEPVLPKSAFGGTDLRGSNPQSAVATHPTGAPHSTGAPQNASNTNPSTSGSIGSEQPNLMRQNAVAGQATRSTYMQSSQQPRNEIRQVSGASSFSTSKPTRSPGISMVSPAIEVQAFGPTSVGVNKKANYQVVIQNMGRVDAEKILIGLNVPAWVDIQKIAMTNGSKKVGGDVKDARLLWTVDRVPAGSTQTLSIEAVPRKAEMFDLGVEWTYLPRVAATSVAVTQPRLEMKISGPRDVLYGEKAIYHVTVRNPGTGVAENVHVKLPEALGGERASLESIDPGKEKNFQVELLARTAGELDLIATATASGELNVSANRPIIVRRAKLEIGIAGPPMKYAGGVGSYQVDIANNGDAMAQDVIAAVALPLGVKYLGGVEAAKTIDGGVRWNVGTLAPGDKRSYKFNCELNSAGELQMEAGVRGTGDLAASNACVTKVDTIADLVLSVQDPKGPLPVGDNVVYKINIRNRGTRAAQAVKIVMQFSEGIEPAKAEGHQNRVIPGQVIFDPIQQIEPGQELVFYVTAQAQKAGTHVFRAQLICSEADSREIAEGTTRFFGDQPEEMLKRQRTASNDETSFAPIRK